jgi:hypothetical protein
MGDLFDPSKYVPQYTRETPPWWTLPVPRLSIEGAPGQMNYGAGVDVPVGSGTLGIDTRFGPRERGIRGTYRREF